jgi:hypothetical protein
MPGRGREDSNFDMTNWKSDARACPREAAEPVSIGIHKSLEILEYREPYRICGVQSFGEKWASWRKMSRLGQLVRPELK